MRLTRIAVQNFRTFGDLDVSVTSNMVIVGENRVGKSNFLYALRLIFDPSLPDSARQLTLADFWDGIDEPGQDDMIKIFVEIKDFESDLDVLAVLTEFRLSTDPTTVRLNYEFRPKPGLTSKPATEDDYEFVCYGGEDGRNTFGHSLRRRITMDVLPALRDAEGDLASWGRSPLRPLVEHAFSKVARANLVGVKEAVETATDQLLAFDSVDELDRSLADLYVELSGSRQDIKPSLGLGSTDVTRLYRNIRLLVDDERRSISEASLGSANIMYLALKALDLQRQIDENKRDHTLLAIEEPEAHLHPQLQRSVYRHLFNEFGRTAEAGPISILLTTHSPHIVSIAPLRSILLLKDKGENGTVGYSTAGVELTDADQEDLARYLDVTRAEMLFARGIILVEGDAEKFLLPVFSQTLGYDLDHLGITVCSVAGTHFLSYVRLLNALGIPFSVITDWDAVRDRTPLGIGRGCRISFEVSRARTGQRPTELAAEFKASIDALDFDTLRSRFRDFAVFENTSTLELELVHAGFAPQLIEVCLEQQLTKAQRAWVEAWAVDSTKFSEAAFLEVVGEIGKGRFAQRFASRVAGILPPEYIRLAIESLVSRV